VRQDYERDPSLLLRQVRALPDSVIVFIDEAQKVPTLFDTAQYLIDERKASFIFSCSSARKLRRKGVNLLPGRVLSLRLDPLMWSETGQSVGGGIPQLRLETGTHSSTYSFDEGLVYGALPGIASEPRVEDRAQFLRSYAQIYIEEEIRAEAMARNIGSFSRFLEMAASESGGTPNYNKLSMESGVSAPTIKAYFSVLEDTLVIERVEPYL
jgi:predicted AAA+ superfamily ATPase